MLVRATGIALIGLLLQCAADTSAVAAEAATKKCECKNNPQCSDDCSPNTLAPQKKNVKARKPEAAKKSAPEDRH